MLKFLLYIDHGRLALMGIYASLTARHLTNIYCIFCIILTVLLANKFLSLSLSHSLSPTSSIRTSE